MEENQTVYPHAKGWPLKTIVFIVAAVLVVAALSVLIVRSRSGENYEPAKRLIDNGHIITMDPELGSFKGDILLDGDQIVEIAPEIKPGRGVETIDATDMIVMPV
ncbi:hypothetical protein IRY61_05860 [Candidatus Saccharibacteria bacterium]|nr:hypothetical protein [Candidatus Saccharibacteria bacterium]